MHFAAEYTCTFSTDFINIEKQFYSSKMCLIKGVCTSLYSWIDALFVHVLEIGLQRNRKAVSQKVTSRHT